MKKIESKFFRVVFPYKKAKMKKRKESGKIQ